MQNLIGILLPALIDSINSRIVESKARFWVSVAVCAVVAVIVEFLMQGHISGPEQVATDILAMFGVAQITYKAVWEKNPVRDSMNLNARTNGTDEPTKYE